MDNFQPQPIANQLAFSELISALSLALDITEGQPQGHCIRVCWIGFHIGQELGLKDQDLWDLYYTLLLKDLGCSSNAARICELYMTDDLHFKHNYKTLNTSLAQVVRFVLNNTGLQKSLAEKFKVILNIMKNGENLTQELVQTRCDRGAEIAKDLRFNRSVCDGIRNLDEHWDGTGKPDNKTQNDIPIFSRIALLSQIVDVFYQVSGKKGAIKEILFRSGTWFDPSVVSAFENVAKSGMFWDDLDSQSMQSKILGLEPANYSVMLDEDYLDEIASAFGQIVDSKSPYTAGHSERVALYVDLIAKKLGFDKSLRRWLKRGALLHDLGKLGVSNSILDKPSGLTDDEWQQMRRHPGYTEEILARISAFSELAVVAGAHHERMDGKGYPKKLSGDVITMATRAITTADIFDALTAERPYRAAMPIDESIAIMEGMVGTAIDRECLDALKS